MEELDFYFSQEQLEIIRSDINRKHYCCFKGQIYIECCEKGTYKNNKNNFSDSVYLGSGNYNDITIK